MKPARTTAALLEETLGTRSKVAILRCLFHSKLGHSGSGLAKLTGIGLYAVQGSLRALESLGLVEVERGRVENRYKLNVHHYLLANGLRALFVGEREIRQALAEDLRPLLEKKVIAAGLFGSFARGTAKVGSDIDVLVVVKSRKDYDRVSAALSDAQSDLTKKYGLPVQAVVFELHRLLNPKTGSSELLNEAARDWYPITGLHPKNFKKSA